MAKSPIPIPLQYVVLYLGLSIEIPCHFHVAGSELGKPSLHCLGVIGLLFGLLASPVKPMLIPGILMYSIFVFFVLRPKASAYFRHSDNAPNQNLANG